MRSSASSAAWKNASTIAAIGIAWTAVIAICAMTGLMVAWLPTSLVIRIAIIPIGIGALALLWMLRSKSSGLPGSWLFALLISTVCLSIIWPRYVFFSIGGPHVNPQTLSVFASIAAIIFWSVYSPEFSTKIYKAIFNTPPIGALIIFWFVWRLIASALGDFPATSVLENIRDLIYISSFLIIGCAIMTFQDGPQWMIRAIVASAFVVALAGLVEAVQQKNYFVQFASGSDSQAVADSLKSILLDKTRDGAYRAQSTFDHPIVFAQFIAAAIPLAVYVATYERHWIWRLIAAMVLPLGMLVIMKSGSRSGLVSLAVAIGFIGVFIWLKSITSKGFGKVFAIAALPALLLGIAIGYFVIQELVLGRSSSEVSSSSVRLKMIWDSVDALKESPITGFGHGMALLKAGVISGHTGTPTLDSLILNISLDYGYFGLAIFLIAVTTFTLKAGLASIRLRDQEGARTGMLVASFLALIATFVGLSIGNNMTLLWLVVACALPSIDRAAKTQAPHP